MTQYSHAAGTSRVVTATQNAFHGALLTLRSHGIQVLTGDEPGQKVLLLFPNQVRWERLSRRDVFMLARGLRIADAKAARERLG